MNSPVKTILVGLGRWSDMFHIKVLTDSPCYDLIGVSDLSRAAVDRVSKDLNIDGYYSLEEALENKEAELIVFCTPGAVHEDNAVAALDAGRHVVLEKPFCQSVSQADRMITASKKAGKILTVMQNRRWDSDFVLVRSLIERGLIGTVRVIKSSTFCGYGYFAGTADFQPDWRIKKAHGGGLLWDWGPHMIDQALLLTSEAPLSLYCSTMKGIVSKEVEEHFKLIINFPGQVMCELESSWTSYLENYRWLVIGDKGTIRGGWESEMIIHTEVNGVASTVIPAEQGVRGVEERLNGGAAYYKKLYRAIREDAQPPVTLDEAREVVRVLETAEQSAAAGQVMSMRE